MQTSLPGDKAALKQSQKENKQLKKELASKEKALTEAAILVLRKKRRDYYGETDEDR